MTCYRSVRCNTVIDLDDFFTSSVGRMKYAQWRNLVYAINISSIFTYLSSAQCWSTVQWFDKTQCKSLEAIQRRAIHIIFPVSVGMPYFTHWVMPKSRLFTLVVKKLINVFFRSMSHPSSCISPHYPTTEMALLLLLLRSAAIYPRPASRTKRFTSSVQYSLLNY